MFEIHFLVFLDLINIYTDTKTIKIEAFIANLQAHPVFRAAILNFEFLARKPRATIWFPLFLNSAYSKTPRCKFSCFYPEVHDMAEKCHISAPLHGKVANDLVLFYEFVIVEIHKQGKPKHDKTSYQPISLLSCTSKSWSEWSTTGFYHTWSKMAFSMTHNQVTENSEAPKTKPHTWLKKLKMLSRKKPRKSSLLFSTNLKHLTKSGKKDFSANSPNVALKERC